MYVLIIENIGCGSMELESFLTYDNLIKRGFSEEIIRSNYFTDINPVDNELNHYINTNMTFDQIQEEFNLQDRFILEIMEYKIKQRNQKINDIIPYINDL